MAKKSINILDKDCTRWVKELSTRYRKSQKNVPKIGEQKEDFPITPQVVEQIAHYLF